MLYDRDIREPLFEYLEFYHGKIRILEEKQIGRSRADVVMVLPGALVGIEIKSDADSYTRLKRQVRDYNRFYDYNYVVVGSTHAIHVREHIPAWWGIISAEEIPQGIDFYRVREAQENPHVDDVRKMGILWRPELAHIQELNNLPEYKEKSKAFVIEKLLQKVPNEILKKQISEELFERDYTTIDSQIRDYKKQRRRKTGGTFHADV